MNSVSGVCEDCDFTKCVTCENASDNCILDCNPICKTCRVDGKCSSCHDGFFLDTSTNNCVQCDNTSCATCTGSAASCDLDCDSSCKTCDPT